MNGSTITLIVSGIVAVLGGAGVWTWLSTRHRPPIERAEAEQARESATVEQALAVAKQAWEATERQGSEISRLGEQVAALRQESNAWRLRYRAALEYLRAVMEWAMRHTGEGAESPPKAPELIVDDVWRRT